MDNLSLYKMERSETENIIKQRRNELHTLETKLSELNNKIRLLTSVSNNLEPETKLEVPVIEQENQKVKSLHLNTK